MDERKVVKKRRGHHDKHEIDRDIALLLNRTRHDVSTITSAFLEKMAEKIVTDQSIWLPWLGQLKLKEYKFKKPFVHQLVTGTFRKGQRIRTLKVLIRRTFHVNFAMGKHMRQRLKELYGSSGDVLK